MLEIYTNEHASGHYAFQMVNRSAVEPANCIPSAGELAGTGEAQLFKVEITEPTPLSIVYEGAAGNNDEVYARLHAPPNRQLLNERNKGVGAEHATLVPLAAPGTWYLLVYGLSVPDAGAFTLHADAPAIRLASVTPNAHGANASAALSLTSACFLPWTLAELVRNGEALSAEYVMVNGLDRLAVTLDLAGQEVGLYDLRFTRPEGETNVLADAFPVTPAGAGVLQARKICPGRRGRYRRRRFP